jgi:hypothetical protein
MKRYKGHVVKCGCDGLFCDTTANRYPAYEPDWNGKTPAWNWPDSGKYAETKCPTCGYDYWYLINPH